ncbi:HAUS4, partial [Cervus elaphus hippelaphus]
PPRAWRRPSLPRGLLGVWGRFPSPDLPRCLPRPSFPQPQRRAGSRGFGARARAAVQGCGHRRPTCPPQPPRHCLGSFSCPLLCSWTDKNHQKSRWHPGISAHLEKGWKYYNKNPHFSQLLLSLSQHVDESGLSLTLAKEQARAWKDVRLHKTTWLRSEILQRVIQELLVDYYVKAQDTDLTSEDRKFHETLEQRLLVTELTRLLGPSQEREVPPLLGLEKADLLELMPPSEDFVWMRARLPLEVEEQLKKKCFTVLCYHNPSSDLDSETLKAAKVWNLAEVLAGEKQQCQAAKSQQKEQMVLLEKKSATYSQVLLRCLALLQRLLQEHRLKTQSELDRINAQYLEIKCSAMILKLRMEELKILSDTYTTEKVEVHRLIRDRLEGAIRLQEQDMEKSRQVLNTYEVLGEEFDKLVKEYTQLKQATENRRWTLQEFNKAYR